MNPVRIEAYLRSMCSALGFDIGELWQLNKCVENNLDLNFIQSYYTPAYKDFSSILVGSHSLNSVQLESGNKNNYSPLLCKAVCNSSQIIWANTNMIIHGGIMERMNIPLNTAVGLPICSVEGELYVFLFFSVSSIKLTPNIVDYLLSLLRTVGLNGEGFLSASAFGVLAAPHYSELVGLWDLNELVKKYRDSDASATHSYFNCHEVFLYCGLYRDFKLYRAPSFTQTQLDNLKRSLQYYKKLECFIDNRENQVDCGTYYASNSLIKRDLDVLDLLQQLLSRTPLAAGQGWLLLESDNNSNNEHINASESGTNAQSLIALLQDVVAFLGKEERSEKPLNRNNNYNDHLQLLHAYGHTCYSINECRFHDLMIAAMSLTGFECAHLWLLSDENDTSTKRDSNSNTTTTAAVTPTASNSSVCSHKLFLATGVYCGDVMCQWTEYSKSLRIPVSVAASVAATMDNNSKERDPNNTSGDSTSNCCSDLCSKVLRTGQCCNWESNKQSFPSYDNHNNSSSRSVNTNDDYYHIFQQSPPFQRNNQEFLPYSKANLNIQSAFGIPILISGIGTNISNDGNNVTDTTGPIASSSTTSCCGVLVFCSSKVLSDSMRFQLPIMLELLRSAVQMICNPSITAVTLDNSQSDLKSNSTTATATNAALSLKLLKRIATMKAKLVALSESNMDEYITRRLQLCQSLLSKSFSSNNSNTIATSISNDATDISPLKPPIQSQQKFLRHEQIEERQQELLQQQQFNNRSKQCEKESLEQCNFARNDDVGVDNCVTIRKYSINERNNSNYSKTQINSNNINNSNSLLNFDDIEQKEAEVIKMITIGSSSMVAELSEATSTTPSILNGTASSINTPIAVNVNRNTSQSQFSHLGQNDNYNSGAVGDGVALSVAALPPPSSALSEAIVSVQPSSSQHQQQPPKWCPTGIQLPAMQPHNHYNHIMQQQQLQQDRFLPFNEVTRTTTTTVAPLSTNAYIPNNISQQQQQMQQTVSPQSMMQPQPLNQHIQQPVTQYQQLQQQLSLSNQLQLPTVNYQQMQQQNTPQLQPMIVQRQHFDQITMHQQQPTFQQQQSTMLQYQQQQQQNIQLSQTLYNNNHDDSKRYSSKSSNNSIDASLASPMMMPTVVSMASMPLQQQQQDLQTDRTFPSAAVVNAAVALANFGKFQWPINLVEGGGGGGASNNSAVNQQREQDMQTKDTNNTLSRSTSSSTTALRLESNRILGFYKDDEDDYDDTVFEATLGITHHSVNGKRKFTLDDTVRNNVEVSNHSSSATGNNNHPSSETNTCGDGLYNNLSSSSSSNPSSALHDIVGLSALCKVEGCFSLIEGLNMQYCLAHRAMRRCQKDGCRKCAQGATKYCISHGGGRRCTYPGCFKGARDKLFCAAHGGGKRCTHEGCTKSAVGGSQLCTAHGGGKRCQFEGCNKSSQSSTDYCVKHGGGRTCRFNGCNKVARGKTEFCAAHGGGVRCKVRFCHKLAVGAQQLCRHHSSALATSASNLLASRSIGLNHNSNNNSNNNANTNMATSSQFSAVAFPFPVNNSNNSNSNRDGMREEQEEEEGSDDNSLNEEDVLRAAGRYAATN